MPGVFLAIFVYLAYFAFPLLNEGEMRYELYEYELKGLMDERMSNSLLAMCLLSMLVVSSVLGRTYTPAQDTVRNDFTIGIFRVL